MKLIEALGILRQPVAEDAPRLTVALACGFTPLHLETFLAAELRRSLPDSRIEVSTGLFDDLAGNVRRAEAEPSDAVALVLEWADIDPRLGLRRLGGWRVTDLPDVLESASAWLASFRDAVVELASAKPVVCCLPTLPLPPIFPPHRDESGLLELQLRSMIASFAADLSAHPAIRIVSAQTLEARSPAAERRDLRSELATGFPYSLGHASAVAEVLASLIRHRPPKKGLITDLDDTLWAGTVGELGADNVSWTLEGHGQQHGLYQQLLASLASAGVLLAVASKNDPEVVDQVFERPDLLLPRELVFPIEAHWERKSKSVERILETWNIAADDVVFVDDTPMELAEVQEAFPALNGVLFPGADGDLWGFLGLLRDLFGKHSLTEEDSLRLASIRSTTAFRSASESGRPLDDFLRRAEGKIEFSLEEDHDQRALELINKTNQFNLNGRRLNEAEFGRLLDAPSAYLLTVTYEDKFGPLGKIAAAIGRIDGDTLAIDAWVMSCRAFSRQIEHHTLSYLFDAFGADEIVLSYAATERNRPLGDFLGSLVGTPLSGSGVRLTRKEFEAKSPSTVHQVSGASR